MTFRCKANADMQFRQHQHDHIDQLRAANETLQERVKKMEAAQSAKEAKEKVSEEQSKAQKR